MVKKCLHCQREFTPRSREERAGRARWCSRECWKLALAKLRLDLRKSRERICEVCHVLFHPTAAQLARGDGRFCSVRCLGIRLRKDNSDYVIRRDGGMTRLEHVIIVEKVLG